MFSPLFVILGLCVSFGSGSPLFERDSNGISATGDSQCTEYMCISAIVNGTGSVEYELTSTGAQALGWMAMGFGSTMANTPMVIMWPNSDGSITLSQRTSTGHSMPTVQSSPPRIAAASTTLSTTSGTKPKLVFTIPANTDTQQSIIWAFGTTAPSSSAQDATLQQHVGFGPLTLDLTKPLSSNSTSSSSSSSASSSSAIPLTSTQRIILAHGILCAVGFLFILPAGALLARYMRTFSNKWFMGHAVMQFILSGPVILVGVSLGFASSAQLGGQSDMHKRYGVILFLFYLLQCSLGAVIHWIKPKNAKRRPAQNYFHGVLGIAIIGLAFYQVWTGYHTEWPKMTGLGNVPNGVNVFWLVWVVLIPVLYFAGLALLPRQFGQERAYKKAEVIDSPAFQAFQMRAV
ncbi:CBD9-like protein [Athelia psychrophila]|uniref:CBD9-like protein n=1 Tax=Athelia psychrophila TaxID=1759441 RepID=A0A166WXS6_9AGAM|nr:CBD9-like protein [Fibularhizoctonia sp. CBS 109695]